MQIYVNYHHFYAVLWGVMKKTGGISKLDFPE